MTMLSNPADENRELRTAIEEFLLPLDSTPIIGRMRTHLERVIKIATAGGIEDFDYLRHIPHSANLRAERVELDRWIGTFGRRPESAFVSANALVGKLLEHLSAQRARSLPILNQTPSGGTPASIQQFKKFNHGDRFKGFICPNPFAYAELRPNGDLSTCCYLPFTMGNVRDGGVKAVWNSDVAKEVRRSILDGDYSYCDAKKCAAMQQVTLDVKRDIPVYQIPYHLFTHQEIADDPRLSEVVGTTLANPEAGPKMVSFEDDPSCNLGCPSCRVQKVMVPQEESDRLFALEQTVLSEIGPTMSEAWFCGAGEPFASKSYRKLYKEFPFQDLPNLRFRFDTNGTPLTEHVWTKLIGHLHDRINLIAVSVDAATAETYVKTRVGGNWETLQQNLKFISERPERKSGMAFIIRMIVQKKNFREMKAFVELGHRLKVDSVVFSVIQNWGHLGEEQYDEYAVHNPNNPLYPELVEILEDPIFDQSFVNLGNLTKLYAVIRQRSQNRKSPRREASNPPSGVRAIAFYLPQFHPLPENNAWWGNGFTEWTNAAKGRPFFQGHYQPHIPADLGFYDLRLPESRAAQADLARAYGVEGFCYYHYWFGNGRRILERPFNEVLASGSPDFPFCLCWANATWSGVWHGAPDRILIEQQYPGEADHRRHFETLLPAFQDPRYIKVDGRPVFMIYNPSEIPDFGGFVRLWRRLAQENGLPGLYLIAHMTRDGFAIGCDASVDNAPFTKIAEPDLQVTPTGSTPLPRIKGYDALVRYLESYQLASGEQPLVVPNWDNTPRSGAGGFVLHGSTPELFEEMYRGALQKISWRPQPERFVWIKAWNEWAEGNHLEPDLVWGRRYLEVVSKYANQAFTEPSRASAKVDAELPELWSSLL